MTPDGVEHVGAGAVRAAWTAPFRASPHGVLTTEEVLATLAVDGEVRFASAADRAAFAEELTAAITTLVARYHDDSAPDGRPHRVVVAVHPVIGEEHP